MILRQYGLQPIKVNKMEDLVNEIKANPGKLRASGTGTGAYGIYPWRGGYLHGLPLMP
jgi:hypothetical protein